MLLQEFVITFIDSVACLPMDRNNIYTKYILAIPNLVLLM